jgi:hypothetical protein
VILAERNEESGNIYYMETIYLPKLIYPLTMYALSSDDGSIVGKKIGKV